MAIRQTAGRDALRKFASKFAELNDDVLFGEVWSREAQLSLRDRSLVTVTALMAQGLTDTAFQYHLQSAKKNGITKEEIAEILTHADFYAGWPKAWAAFRMAKEVWAEDTEGADAKTGGGQILIGVAGRGFYQEWGKEAVELLPGTVVHIPAGVKHWHGAAPDSWFSHLAVEVPGEALSNEWKEAINDEDYFSATHFDKR